jgi:DNA-binding NarL/FixJ family response regulator
MQRRLPSLTENEQRVVALVARGYSTRAIAKELGVTFGTARAYVVQVLDFMRQRGRAEAGEAPRLTNREAEVVALVRTEATDKQIAEALGVSLRTAEDHVYRILRKLGYGTRRDLADMTAR